MVTAQAALWHPIHLTPNPHSRQPKEMGEESMEADPDVRRDDNRSLG